MTEDITTFDGLCNRAVKAFMQSVVVIDNEASLNSDNSRNSAPPVNAARKRTTAPGMVKASPTANFKDDKEKLNAEASNTEEEPEAHRLELNKVSQAFAEQELTCGVYLPTEQDPAGMEELIRATVQAIRPTDACVLDWQLRKGDSKPAIESIKKVIQRDKEEGGRLRLILIYTAEKLDDAFPALQTALEDENYQVTVHDLEDGPVIASDHFRIVFINKPTRMWNQEGATAVVQWKDLPQRIIREFTILSRGLLRAFALESVAAVRRDIHRILAQFDEDLDPVYAGDRATKPDPDDAGHLVVELLQSELSLSIEASGAKNNTLGPQSCMAWLEENNHLFLDVNQTMRWHDGRPENKKIDIDVRKHLITNGSKYLKTRDFHAKVTRAFFAEDQEPAWKNHSSNYAVLTTLAYHSGEQVGRVTSRAPALKFGTVIGNSEDDWLCIQPACDTVRITDKASFLFIKLVPNEEDFDLIIPKDDQLVRFQVANEGKSKHLRELSTLWFEPSEGEDIILSQSIDSNGFFFTDTGEERWTWRAQLREMTAVHLAQKAVRAIGRIGLNEFEWLRTSAK